MTESISNPGYWAQRLKNADQRHHAIFHCPLERWRAIERQHRRILARLIKAEDAVLDCGCAWGRLLDLLPTGWHGPYLGVDLSPEFIALARQERPGQEFMVADLRDLSSLPTVYDWAVMISIRPMVQRNLGDAEWIVMERQIKRVARKLLFLEYDERDTGQVADGGVS